MASSYVRNTFRNWLNDASLAVPFYDTINQEQNPSDPIWCTVDFIPYERDQITYCGDVAERGFAEVIYYGSPGVGDAALLAAVEADILIIDGLVDAKLTKDSMTAPNEYSNGDAEKDYILSVEIEYTYYL